MRVLRLALAIAVVALIGSGSATAENYAQETLDRYFRIEYQVTPSATQPVISGYVYNMNPGLSAERVQLSIEGLDASGNVIATSSTWVLGGVPAGNRGYFTAKVKPASTYQVHLLAFDWVTRGGSSN